MKRLLCKILGHSWRGCEPSEHKAAVAELQAGRRKIEELPVQVCRRCKETWGFGFGVAVPPLRI